MIRNPHSVRTSRLIRSLIFAMIAALLLSRPSQASVATPDLERQVDALMAESVRGDTPGGEVLVARDGHVVFEKGYGLANVAAKSPITADTRFRIGSITKQFTAAAIFKLAEQGRL